MQPSNPFNPLNSSDDEEFDKQVTDYRSGGRQEKHSITDSSKGLTAADFTGVTDIMPTAMNSQSQVINLDSELNPFYTPPRQSPNSIPSPIGNPLPPQQPNTIRGGW